MYDSLKKNCDDFHLYIFAFDDKAFELLGKLNLEKTTLISLKEFENDELLAVKSSRSKAEYCWTCTPSVIKYVLAKYKTDSCTYIDADLFFYSSPKSLFDEMGNASVLITEHRYTKKYDRSKLSGKYCVQFITFNNDTEGLNVLNWWSNACIEWCYNLCVDGKFGDQKYLDDWTTRFNGVHELKHLGGGVAPWNIQQYEISNSLNNKLFLITKNEFINFEVVFFHFHYVRFYKNNIVDLGWLKLSKQIINEFYAKYIRALVIALEKVKKVDPNFQESLLPFSIKESKGLKEKLKVLLKKTTKFNLFHRCDFN